MEQDIGECVREVEQTETGGPAFPVVGMQDRNGSPTLAVFHGGMTLRDYFAAAALTGLCAKYGIDGTPESNADAAFQFASAMLKQSAQTEKGDK